MINRRYGSKRIVRYDGTRILAFTYLDQGHDPLEIFDVESQALRRDIGDLRFLQLLDSQGNYRGRLFLAPEFPTQARKETGYIISMIVISLNAADFGKRFEIDVRDVAYGVLDWKAGLSTLQAKAEKHQAIADKDLFKLLLAIDDIDRTDLSSEEIRMRLGPETGARIELSLS